ncbi:MAG: (deoxy)nucleoside triphosphate pyrophosphohydrolase [Candidatus Eisenbacteria bacterium]|uniref:8-oxo-dGTP diphosphatase n=1 Tax=Eiseniibacteriota bacterium TaxID=2212470 RepID=A0A956N8N7_UNCEI|nr:(deoxy)nucleoside triphosphate pyrophosphohydrolase [Candidatus Eisenbacteria bacterium]MCB9465070.1 (deoxy)nucleoside triphosphate pyrophosphohydrolase [Candidatus Eisenbacteria bacterium]
MGARVHVSVAIVVRPTSVPDRAPWILLGRRHPHVHMPDVWEFPGGKVEPDEESADCAVREVWEETGVRVQHRGLFLRTDHDYPDRHLRIDFQLCCYIDGDPEPRACQAVRWVRLDHMQAYQFPDGSRDVLAKLASVSWSQLLPDQAPIGD